MLAVLQEGFYCLRLHGFELVEMETGSFPSYKGLIIRGIILGRFSRKALFSLG